MSMFIHNIDINYNCQLLITCNQEREAEEVLENLGFGFDPGTALPERFIKHEQEVVCLTAQRLIISLVLICSLRCRLK